MADIRSLEMPKWGMTMDEGTLTRWLVSEGDSVSTGDVLAEAESSKLSGDIESPISGKLVRILASEGDTLPVAAPLAVLADTAATDAEIEEYLSSLGSSGGASDSASAEKPSTDDDASVPADSARSGSLTQESEELPSTTKAATESDPAGSTPPRGGTQGKGSGTQASPTAPRADGSTQTDSIPDSLKGSDSEEVPATPHAAKLAKNHGIALSKVEATGRGERVTVADLQKAVADAGGHLSFGNDLPRKGTAAVRGDDSTVDASVHARKLAEAEGVNLLAVRASGRNGRVTLADVQAWIALNRAPEPAPAEDKQGTPSQSQSDNAMTEIPLSTMRKVIGSRLHESYSQSPHFRVSAEATIDSLLAFRKEVNEHRIDLKLSVNDLVTTAVSRALKRVPEVNAQFDGETITQFEHADISIAVATDEGLITPIVRAADTLTPGEISAEVTDLATRAKAGTLKPEEFQGGTFTISNLGMFGISHFDAIINPPQVAILAVGGAQRRFVPDAEGNPVAATVLEFTLSADHRVVDGATSARFCKELKTLLETPALIFA